MVSSLGPREAWERGAKRKMKAKIRVVGAGYVGMSLAVLLARDNVVTVLNIDAKRVAQINRRESTVVDAEISDPVRPKI